MSVDLIQFEALVAPIPGLVSTFAPEPYEAVLGVPTDMPNHFLFHERRLVGVMLSVGSAGRATLRERLGEPHDEWTDGPYTDSIWRGKVADIQMRTGGQIGNTEDAVVFVSHRESCERLRDSAAK